MADTEEKTEREPIAKNRRAREIRSCDLQSQGLSCAMLVRITLPVGVLSVSVSVSAPPGHRFFGREGC